MVGIGTAMIALGLWFGIAWWRKRDIPKTPWFLRIVAVSGIAAIVAMESGWIVTEVGRQPWIVQGLMRTEQGVTGASGIWLTFSIVLVLYTVLGRRDGARAAQPGAALARAGLGRGRRPVRAPRGAARTGGWRPGMSKADVAAAILWVGATLYAVFGGADFGAGLLVARRRRAASAPSRARRLIDSAIGPVWEANHVWLIFILVVLWTAFSGAFEAIMSTLFIPLSLAALGIVLRGSGFAFHEVSPSAAERSFAERLFAASSVITPFFMGTVVGAIASGRVPVGNATGDPWSSWLNPVSILDRGALRRHRRLPRRGLPDQRRAHGRRRRPRRATSAAGRSRRRSPPARSPWSGSSTCAPTPATSTTASPPTASHW